MKYLLEIIKKKRDNAMRDYEAKDITIRILAGMIR